MHIPKLKVKPKRQAHVQVCAVELTAMLACWASTADTANVGQCKAAADALHACMSKPTLKGKPRRPTINYHLSKLGN